MDNVRPASRSVNISDEVLTRVAALAAKDVEGVIRLSGSRSVHNPLGNAVRIQNLGGAIAVNLGIVVKTGSRAVPIAKQVQNAVKQGIQDMTGVTAVHVNVQVDGMEDED
ncbi:MAG: Asp23/Gls24 family envelope stress response protein [Oscillospiraceae bacterium]|nr:Asp23/Gls24 family envelope stress response protein [Oscillospiraceae bacterium]